MQAVCRFRHIRDQSQLEYIVTICNGRADDEAAAMVCNTQFMRLCQSLGVSSNLGGGTYGISNA
jgi:hypothetical protein